MQKQRKKSIGIKVQRHMQKSERTIDTEELIGSLGKGNKYSSKHLGWQSL